MVLLAMKPWRLLPQSGPRNISRSGTLGSLIERAVGVEEVIAEQPPSSGLNTAGLMRLPRRSHDIAGIYPCTILGKTAQDADSAQIVSHAKRLAKLRYIPHTCCHACGWLHQRKGRMPELQLPPAMVALRPELGNLVAPIEQRAPYRAIWPSSARCR
jgi:hypothetical protein